MRTILQQEDSETDVIYRTICRQELRVIVGRLIVGRVIVGRVVVGRVVVGREIVGDAKVLPFPLCCTFTCFSGIRYCYVASDIVNLFQ